MKYGIQSFVLISSCFFSRRGFRTLRKNCYKHKCVTQLHRYLAQMKRVYIKLNLRTKFAINLINIQGVMSVYSHKVDITLSRLQGKPSSGIT